MEWEETCDEDITSVILTFSKVYLVLKYGFVCVISGIEESIKNHGTP